MIRLDIQAQYSFRILLLVQEWKVGSAGFEPAASSAQGWHHTKLDNDPDFEFRLVQVI